MRTLSLVALCLLAGCGAELPLMTPSERHRLDAQLEAAQRAVRAGDDAAARRELRQVLSGSPDLPRAVELMSALEVNEGHLARARAVLAPILGPDAPPTAAVLADLIARRQGHPGEGWRVSYRAAWNAAGRPDLQAGQPFSWPFAPSHPGCDEEHVRAAARAAHDPSQRLLLSLVGMQPQLRLPKTGVLDAVHTPGVALAVLDQVHQAHPNRARRLARAWEARFPGQAMDFALWAADHKGSWKRPLTQNDVVALEAISRLPRRSPNLYGDTARALLQATRSAGLPCAGRDVITGAVGVAPDGLVDIQRRLKLGHGNLDGAWVRRAVRAVWRIGLAEMRGRSLLEKLVGVAVLGSAATYGRLKGLLPTVRLYQAIWRRILRQGDRASLNLPIVPLERAELEARFHDEFEAFRWLTAPPGKPEPTVPPLPADPYAKDDASAAPGH